MCTSTKCGAEAGPRTERINESASHRAEASPQTERINESTSRRAEAGPWTETINGVARQWTDYREQRIADSEGSSKRTEAVHRTAPVQDSTEPPGGDGQVTKPKQLMGGADSDPQEEEKGRDGEIPPHMKNFIECSIKGWSQPQQEAIRRMLLQFQDVFSKDDLDIGQTHLMEAEIDTGNAKPVRSRPRPMARSMEMEGRKTIGQMEERGLI